MFTKRALSDVVTTVLIILLVLASIGIVWSFVLPLIQRAGEEVNADCFTISLTPQACIYYATAGTVDVVLKRGTGEGELKDVKLIFNDGEVVLDASDTSPVTLSVLESQQFSAVATGVLTTTPVEFSVAPVVGDNNKVCNPLPSTVLCVPGP